MWRPAFTPFLPITTISFNNNFERLRRQNQANQIEAVACGTTTQNYVRPKLLVPSCFNSMSTPLIS
jgi:hypothetical protein